MYHAFPDPVVANEEAEAGANLLDAEVEGEREARNQHRQREEYGDGVERQPEILGVEEMPPERLQERHEAAPEPPADDVRLRGARDHVPPERRGGRRYRREGGRALLGRRRHEGGGLARGRPAVEGLSHGAAAAVPLEPTRRGPRCTVTRLL